MIFWNVILVSYFYFVWNGTEINVTFHLCRLRQSTQRNIVNINGSSSEWINVWTHFVLEYFITQYLKGLQHNIPLSGLSFYKTMTIVTSPSSLRALSIFFIQFLQSSSPLFPDCHLSLVKLWLVAGNWETGSANIGDIINPSHVIIISTGERFTTSTNCRAVTPLSLASKYFRNQTIKSSIRFNVEVRLAGVPS